jgi:hypothetical protein
LAPILVPIFEYLVAWVALKNTPMKYKNQFETGFDDWKNALVKISSQQTSKEHLIVFLMLLDCKKFNRIDAELQEVYDKSCQYWRKLLKKIVVVVKFLAKRSFPNNKDET